MKNTVLILLSLLLLSGCGVYKCYERPEISADGLYRNPPPATDTTTLASLSWREMFRDTCLHALIEKGLSANIELNIARLRVEAAEASLAAAGLAYYPSAHLNLEGGTSRYGSSTANTYNIGFSASWEADIFGKLKSGKEEARAAVEGRRDFRQAVQTQLVSTIAESYYTLAMLDARLDLNSRTIENWRSTVKTLEALKKAGRANDAGVLQAKAGVMQLESSRLEILKNISETENVLASLLATTPGPVERRPLSGAVFPDTLSVGLPVQLLSNRPDVRNAEMNLAQAYYAVNVARAAFYPSLTLSGTLGWTNNGGIVTNPGQWLMNAIANLTQPLFNRGTNKANLKLAETAQEEAKLLFRQSLLDAGKEVNDALYAWQTANAGISISIQHTDTLSEAVRKTRLLMTHGAATYLEVLTAQQTLLEAETELLQKRFERIRAIISLYHALGGGAH